MAKLTSAKARKILHDKSVHGQPLTDKQRRFFGAIAGGAKPYKAESGGWLDKYDAPIAQNGIEGTMGGLTDKGFNYNGAWGGTMQMGGSLPGAVGFTYARTAGAAPANGPYAKKTKASAQNGMEMKYYQAGLDFKPKTISQDGTVIDPMGYWNPENVGNPVIIPSTDITMEGVDQPLIGISDTGDVQYMQPGEDYTFDGEYVTEYPVAQAGKRVPIIVSDPKDPRLKAYQDSLALYNFYEKSYRQRKKENNVGTESRFKNFIGLNQANQPDNTAQYYSNKKSTLFKKNEIHPIIEYSYKEDSPEMFIDDVYYPAKKNVEKFGFRFKKPVQPVEYRKPEPPTLYVEDPKDPRLKRYQDSLQTYKNSKFGDFRGGDWTDPKGYTWTSKYPEADNYKPRPKKPIQKVEYGKPQPKQEVVKKQEPVTPIVERIQNVYEGTPVYSPGAGSGLGSALIGFMGPKGDTTYIRPEDYERFAVPKYGKEYIEKKKMKNGGVSVNMADQYPIEKLDQSLNFTNYNKPTKGGWLDKYK